MTDEGGVLGNLPSSRPGRRSAKRDRPAKTAARAAAKAEATGKPAAKPPRGQAKPPRGRTTAVKGAGYGDDVALNRDIGGKVQPRPDSVPEAEGGATSGDALGAVVRGAAGVAVTGVKVAGAVTHELLRRLPRP
jgi:hypothetical protein